MAFGKWWEDFRREIRPRIQSGWQQARPGLRQGLQKLEDAWDEAKPELRQGLDDARHGWRQAKPGLQKGADKLRRGWQDARPEVQKAVGELREGFSQAKNDVDAGIDALHAKFGLDRGASCGEKLVLLERPWRGPRIIAPRQMRRSGRPHHGRHAVQTIGDPAIGG